jgi:hypothetical protein
MHHIEMFFDPSTPFFDCPFSSLPNYLSLWTYEGIEWAGTLPDVAGYSQTMMAATIGHVTLPY